MKASEPRLAHDMTSQQAFRAICRACLHDFMLNAAGLAAAPDGGDPVEIVHQGRVALRRLRAALALFKPIVGDDSFVRMNGELKWLAGVFGRARDRDVMAASAPNADPANGRAGDFFSWFEAKRLAARRAVLRAIRSKRWRTFLIDFCEWIEDGAWRRRLDERDDDMHRFIRRRLKKQRNALVKQGAGLERLTPDARHQVRIKAKKLRYMAQFFARLADVADRNHMNYLLGALEELQSALGQMHDEDARIVAAEANVMAWRKDAGDLDPAALAGAERWAAERPIDSGKLLREAIEAYAKLAKAKPF